MHSTLEVTTAASVTALTTLAQLKADGGYDDSQDTLLTRVIEICSNEIAHYLRNGVDEDEDITLGRETIRERFYDLPRGGLAALHLSRWPVGSITSVTENGATITRVESNTDGAITSGDNTFTSAGGPAGNGFTEAYVGQSITIVGAGAAAADLTTTIASYTSATEVELTDAAATTVSGDAAWSVDNPYFTYIVRKQRGEIIKRTGNVSVPFYLEPVTVVYTAGWLLPAEAGRTLPYALEDACILYARKKVDQLQEGQDFSGPLTQASVDGVGSFQFGTGASMSRGSGLPYEVRAIVDKFREPVFA